MVTGAYKENLCNRRQLSPTTPAFWIMILSHCAYFFSYRPEISAQCRERVLLELSAMVLPEAVCQNTCESYFCGTIILARAAILNARCCSLRFKAEMDCNTPIYFAMYFCGGHYNVIVGISALRGERRLLHIHAKREVTALRHDDWLHAIRIWRKCFNLAQQSTTKRCNHLLFQKPSDGVYVCFSHTVSSQQKYYFAPFWSLMLTWQI